MASAEWRARHKARMAADPAYASEQRAKQRRYHKRWQKTPAGKVARYRYNISYRRRKGVNVSVDYYVERDPAVRAARVAIFEATRPDLSEIMDRAISLMTPLMRSRKLELVGTVIIAVADGAIPLDFSTYDIEAARRADLYLMESFGMTKIAAIEDTI